MTVETQTNLTVARGNGATTNWPYNFYIAGSDDLIVERQVYDTGVVDKVYLETSEYTVSGVGSANGGTVTLLGAALASTYNLVLRREVEYKQELDITNQGGFFPETLETQLDLMEMQIQQVAGLADRALLLPIGDNPGLLPTLESLKGYVIGVNAGGDFYGAALAEDGGLRADLASTAGAALVGLSHASTYSAGTVGKTLQLRGVHVQDAPYLAACDNATDDTTAIQDALDSGATIVQISGTAYCATSLTIPAGVELRGPGTVRFPTDVNGITMGNGARMRDIVVDGTTVDDVAGDSGVLLGNDCYLENVTVKNFGFQGFASISGGSSRNVLIGCRAYNVGHRGINLSGGSSHNRITNFQARNCKKAGVLVGYLSNYNIFDDVFIDGVFSTSGGAGLWVHMNSDYNQFSNFQIGPQDGSGTTAPHVLLGAASQYNSFTDFNLYGVGTRGVYVWNLNTDNPGLGTSDAPVVGNVFKGFRVFGTSAANSNALSFKSDDGEVINENTFVDWEITGFEDGVEDLDSLTNGLLFKDLRFGTITGRKMRVGTTADNFRTSRRRNCEGLTAVGSLAIAITEYGAQPAVPATTVAQTQYYPFPVNIYVEGMPAGSNVLINGTNINSTAPNDGNGVHTVYPGQTIALSYASGTPTWRWFGLDW